MRILFGLAVLGLSLGVLLLVALESWPLTRTEGRIDLQGDAKRGAYLMRLAGCIACHTEKDSDPFSGGVELDSKFGSFFSPNITPHPEAGIGTWSIADLAGALRRGVSPDGRPYYPSFPYEFYATLTDRDVADIWAALMRVPASDKRSPQHDLPIPFSVRSGLKLWRTFFEVPSSYTADPDRSDSWNRGRYLVTGPAHCAACHTPRNLAGGLIKDKLLEGDPAMMDGGQSPAITVEALRRNGWTRENLVSGLRSGIMPNGDVFGGSMREVVTESTSYLLTSHLEDMANYLLDLDE